MPEEYMDFEKLKSKVKHFVRERDWEKYKGVWKKPKE